MAHGPEPGTILNERRAHRAAPGGDGHRPARRRRAARGAARPAHAQGALHGRRLGVPGRRGRRARGRGDGAHRAAAVREVAGGGRRSRCPIPPRWCPFARWITPPEVTIRFDTCFFLADAPDGAEARIDGRRSSTRAGSSRRARSRAAEAGELLMVFPTIKNLERLGALRHRRRAARVGGSARGQARPAAASRARARRRASCSTTEMPDGLTVAVTGPTGEIGRAFLRALDRAPRRRPRARAWRGGRSTRPSLGLKQDRVPPGRRARPRRRRRARGRGRRARAPRLHHPRRPRRDPPRSTSPARATSSPRPRARASASSTRRRSPPTASTRTTRSR